MMAIKKQIDGDRVKSSNAIARCRWTDSTDESVWEGRLLAIVASQIRQDDEELKPYTFPIIAVIGGNSGATEYAAIEQTVERAMSRVVTIHEGKRRWSKYNLFHECTCDREEGTLTVQIHPKLKPHYLNLKSNFTQFSLLEYMVIPSVYSQRLFVLLRSWDDKPEVTIPLDELREILGVTGYKMFPDFRRSILERGERHIHQHTTLIYSWEPVKLGQRKVIAVRFIFSRKRAAIVQKQEQAANSKRNNKLGLEAVRCFNEHDGNGCNHNRSKAVCEICKLINPTSDPASDPEKVSQAIPSTPPKNIILG